MSSGQTIAYSKVFWNVVVKAKDEPSRCETEPESHESFVVQLRENEPSNFIKKDEYYQIYYFFF